MGVGLQRGREPDFVEQRRMQQVGDGSNLHGAGSRQIGGLGKCLPSAVRFQPRFLQAAEIDGQGGQELRRAVVQFPAILRLS